jgi:hypothetical protein
MVKQDTVLKVIQRKSVKKKLKLFPGVKALKDSFLVDSIVRQLA